MKPTLLLYALSTGLLWAGQPQFGSIDYANPSKYLAWPDSLGDRTAMHAQAASLKADTDLETIRRVLSWMDKTLRYDGQKAYVWRNFDDVIREKAYGGCADQGMVCGVLLKAAGIPAVWVKTMDVNWIWDFKKGRPFQSWSGHVFVEVWVDHKWMLLDPGGKLLYQEYSPQARILPGNRFAYDKGNDPKAMIMSLQWEEWKRQTEAYFRDLDESLLPVDSAGGTDLGVTAFVAGNSPYYQEMSRIAAEAGLTVKKSFNFNFDTYLPQAHGHVLLVETHNGTPIVPLDLLEKYFPGSTSGSRQSNGSVRVENTTLVFLDFSEPMQKLKLREEKLRAVASETNRTFEAIGSRR